MGVRAELVGGYSDGRVEEMEFITPYVEVPIPQSQDIIDPAYRVDRYRVTNRTTSDGAWIYELESSRA